MGCSTLADCLRFFHVLKSPGQAITFPFVVESLFEPRGEIQHILQQIEGISRTRFSASPSPVWNPRADPDTDGVLPVLFKWPRELKSTYCIGTDFDPTEKHIKIIRYWYAQVPTHLQRLDTLWGAPWFPSCNLARIHLRWANRKPLHAAVA